jgi:hypothetical protein
MIFSEITQAAACQKGVEKASHTCIIIIIIILALSIDPES